MYMPYGSEVLNKYTALFLTLRSIDLVLSVFYVKIFSYLISAFYSIVVKELKDS